MNLSITENDKLNTLFLGPDGRPVYHVDTPSRMFQRRETVVSRTDKPNSIEVARIQWHSWDQTVVMVHGRRIQPYKSAWFSSSGVFQGTDGRSYKWKINGGEPLLVRNDGSRTPIAVYRPRSSIFSSRRPASLNITPEGLPILDDIITTFVYVEHRQRQRRRNQNTSLSMMNTNAATASATAASMSM